MAFVFVSPAVSAVPTSPALNGIALDKVPLQTLRIPLERRFRRGPHGVWYGIIGVKVWLNKRPDLENGAPRPGR